MNYRNIEIPPYFYIVNVEAAIFKGKKWLLIERSEKEEYGGGLLSFVGGKVDKTENSAKILEQTLIREIDEEIGVEIEDKMTYVNSNLFLALEQPVVDIIFLCKYKSGVPHCKSPDEVAKIYWMTLEEVRSHPNIPVWFERNIILAEEVRKRVHC
ncbi:MAG: NUDIX hydrolase [Candidatus Hodarchaeales archaeon]